MKGCSATISLQCTAGLFGCVSTYVDPVLLKRCDGEELMSTYAAVDEMLGQLHEYSPKVDGILRR